MFCSIGESTDEQPRRLRSRVSDLARAVSPSLIGNVRQRDIEQGLDVGQRQNTERTSRLAPNVLAGTLTPSKTRIGRPFSGTKEPKSPSAPRIQSKASAQASAVENGRSSYGELAATMSPDKLDHLMSMAFAKIPPYIKTTPLPLRKRVVSKDAVGAPIVTSPIYPGEMMRRPSTALLPVAAARARVAASREQQIRPQSLLDEAIIAERPTSAQQAPLDMIAEADQELNVTQSLEPVQEDSLEEEQHGDREPSPTSQSAKISRPSSTSRPVSAPIEKRGSATRSLDQAKNPFPWNATPQRKIGTPLANEIRQKLLVDRPVLKNSHSDEPTIQRPISAALQDAASNFLKPRLTSPGDERRALVESGQIDLSPPEFMGFPWNGPQAVQEATLENSWTGSTRSSRSIAGVQPRESWASASATFWSGCNVDPPASQSQAVSSTSQQIAGRPEQCSSQDLREEEAEGREQPSDLRSRDFAPRRLSVSQDGQIGRRLSTWSASSTYSQEPSAPVLSRDFVEEQSVLSSIVEPLKLTASRSPAPPGPSWEDHHQRQKGGESTESTRHQPESFAVRTSPARSTNDSPPSPTSKNVQRGRMDSIASGIMGFFDQPVRANDPVKPLTPSIAPAKSPLLSPDLSQRSVIRERTSSPRTNSPSMLPDIAHFRGRRTVTPAAQPTAPSPRIRFSDAVEVFPDNPGVLSPPPRTIRLLTPPPVETQSHYTGDILSPRPVLRRGSIIPPLPTASPNTANASSKDAPVCQPSPGPSGKTETPPKAVQTREMWREIRRTSATAYYLGAFQAEHDHEG